MDSLVHLLKLLKISFLVSENKCDLNFRDFDCGQVVNLLLLVMSLLDLSVLRSFAFNKGCLEKLEEI